VEQVAAEVTAARESWKLAQGVAANAQARFNAYSNLDQYLRDVEADSFRLSVRKNLASAFVVALACRQTPLPQSVVLSDSSIL